MRLRQGGQSLRAVGTRAAEAIFPFLVSRTEAVRRVALEALAAHAGTGFLDKLPELLKHRDPTVVHVVLDWLRRNPSDRNLSLVGEALDSPSPAVRAKAFSIVETTASPRVVPLALKGLEDQEEGLRYRAVQLLTRFPDESAIGPLLRHCHLDSSRVQDAAINALSPLLAHADIRWNEDLIPLLSDANPRVRQLASRILRTQEPRRVAEAFLHAYQSTFGPMRDRALEGLRELGPHYIPAFLERDNDPDHRVAALASAVAVTIRSPEVVPHCIRYLAGDDWWLRDRAAHALGELRDERGFDPLVAMLADPESNLSAAAALGTWGSARALPALLEAYKKGTKDLRLEILDAFARIPDRAVAALLAKIVQADPDVLVREKAARLAEGVSGDGGGDDSGREFPEHDFVAAPQPTLADLLRHSRAVGASDLHLSTGTIPHVRVNGSLAALPMPELTEAQLEEWVGSILSPERRAVFDERQQLDFCHKDATLGRFRTNVFLQRKGMSAVFRLVPFVVPNLADIGLPESLWELTTYSQGLILVTGPSGCGKTTTLAALVDRVNSTERCHILTIEDPIEYVHANKDSLVHQRRFLCTPGRSPAPSASRCGKTRTSSSLVRCATSRPSRSRSRRRRRDTSSGHAPHDHGLGDGRPVINAFPADRQGQIRQWSRTL